MTMKYLFIYCPFQAANGTLRGHSFTAGCEAGDKITAEKWHTPSKHYITFQTRVKSISTLRRGTWPAVERLWQMPTQPRTWGAAWSQGVLLEYNLLMLTLLLELFLLVLDLFLLLGAMIIKHSTYRNILICLVTRCCLGIWVFYAHCNNYCFYE